MNEELLAKSILLKEKVETIYNQVSETKASNINNFLKEKQTIFVSDRQDQRLNNFKENNSGTKQLNRQIEEQNTAFLKEPFDNRPITPYAIEKMPEERDIPSAMKPHPKIPRTPIDFDKLKKVKEENKIVK